MIEKYLVKEFYTIINLTNFFSNIGLIYFEQILNDHDHNYEY